jgi:HSP20 family protein
MKKELMKAVAQNEERAVRPQPVDAERGYVTPKVNITETQDRYLVEAEFPGVNKEGLEVSLDNNELTIVGRRQSEGLGNLLYRESQTADFRRVFELDPSVDSAKISARIEQGILTVTLPKTEKVKPRRISVS